MAGYFSEQRLHEAWEPISLQKPTDVQVVAYNFPSWHPSKYMEDRFGKGWTEFETLRNARTLFPGHSMPHYPLWVTTTSPILPGLPGKLTWPRPMGWMPG